MLLAFLVLFSATPLAAESEALNHLNTLLLQAGGNRGMVDDPANYAIYEKMEAVVRGLSRTIDNQGDLISYNTVEDSALGDMVEVEQRVRELLVQRSSGLLSPSDKDLIDSELSQLGQDVVDILKGAEFNTIRIFAPLVDDPQLAQTIADPGRLTLDGVDALLDFLSRQRTLVGTRVRTLEHAISGDQIAHENSLALQDQVGLMAHLLMLM